jgi:peptidoglycan pentaglycine glycine transferase (the first glycine)
MPNVTTEPITDEKTWSSTLFSLVPPHFLQSWQWGEHKRAHGWLAHRIAVQRDGEVIGAFQLLTRKISNHPRLTLGYTPRGPIAAKGTDLPAVLDALATVAARQGCFYVKADPDTEDEADMASAWREHARKLGWRYSPEQIQPRATGVTDLFSGDQDGEERLLAGMAKQWRYNIRLGPKRGIKVSPVADNDFTQFYDVFKETGERQGFSVRSLDYYQEIANRFSHGDKTSAQLFLATSKHERSPLAGAFVLSYGKRWWYFYGASSKRRRADMPTYALQWATQRWARDHGGRTYDWWGAPERPDNKRDSRYSVWHFKKGFGPRHVLTVGAWDKPLRPALYYPYMTAAVVRQRLARHKLGRH